MGSILLLPYFSKQTTKSLRNYTICWLVFVPMHGESLPWTRLTIGEYCSMVTLKTLAYHVINPTLFVDLFLGWMVVKYVVERINSSLLRVTHLNSASANTDEVVSVAVLNLGFEKGPHSNCRLDSAAHWIKLFIAHKHKLTRQLTIISSYLRNV